MRSAVLVLALAACGRTGFEPHDAGPDAIPDAKVPRAPLVWHAETVSTVDRFYDLWGSPSGDVYAVGDGMIAHTTGDDSWTFETTPSVVSLYGIDGDNAGDIVVAGNDTGVDGKAIFRPNGDSTWRQEPNSIGPVLNDAYVASATDLYIVGYSGLILHSVGDGNWTSQASGTTATLLSIWGSGPADIYAAGYNGLILHSTGDGTWTPQTTGTLAPLIAIDGSGPTDIWAVGYSGKVLHSTGNGIWASQDANVGFDLFGVFSVDGFVIACGVGNQVITSDGDGVWTTQTLPSTSAAFDAIWGANANDLYIVGAATILRGTR